MDREYGSTCDCKVGRVAEKYDKDDLDAELQRRRLKKGKSLRALADVVNVTILESALESTDSTIVGGVVAVYEALVSDDVAPERRTDVTDQLTYAGIAVDDVTGDFVSHQTVKTHLNECLDIDTSRPGVETLDEGRRIIEWSRERDEYIIEQTLSQLVRTGFLESGPLEITHSVIVRCDSCGDTFHLDEFLDGGSCTCGGDG